tara:strand:- start:48030 stop:48788 length:759 start_codon:yes stop_codon:yes gene_type:complete
MKAFPPLLVVAFIPSLAVASDAGVNFGLGASISSSPYAGEGTSISPLPLIRYESEHFFVNRNRAGVHLIDAGAFTLDGGISLRTDGIDQEDFGRRELAENGVNRDLLDDRDDAIDAQLTAKYKKPFGVVELRISADTGGNGEHAWMAYEYPFSAGPVTLVPGVGARYLSGSLANYHFGISSKEQARGVGAYSPGSTFLPEMGLGMLWPIGDKWAVLGDFRYRPLPDELIESPLVEDGVDSNYSLFLGITRQF